MESFVQINKITIFLCCFIACSNIGVLIQGVHISGHHKEDENLHRDKRATDETEADYYFSYQGPSYPRDCFEATGSCFNAAPEGSSRHPDGVYEIKPTNAPEPFEVYCNNSFGYGGWTVFQRRLDGTINFRRNWAQYKKGFGFPHRDFWLGNDKLAYLTNQKDYQLHVDMVDSNGNNHTLMYNSFRVSDEATNYKLLAIGGYEGPEGFDSFATGDVEFSTIDEDHDNDNSDCAELNNGGWWYDRCSRQVRHHSKSNLNGNITISDTTRRDGVFWLGVGGGITFTQLKVRPVQ